MRYAVVSDERLALKGIRKLIVDSYVVFYAVGESEAIVTIIRILYCKLAPQGFYFLYTKAVPFVSPKAMTKGTALFMNYPCISTASSPLPGFVPCAASLGFLPRRSTSPSSAPPMAM